MIYLDCDGVLFDSAREAFEVAFQVTFGRPSTEQDAPLLEQFGYIRPYVSAAWQYHAFFEAFRAGEYASDVSEINAILKQHPEPDDRDFEDSFFTQRRALMDRDKQAWLNLSPPYHFLLELSEVLIREHEQFTILSTKNTDSIIEMLVAQNTNFAELRILGRDHIETFGGSKASAIENDPNRGPLNLFIDDCERHLADARYMDNVELFHARWGYVPKALKVDNSAIAVERIETFLEELCR